MLYSVRIMLLTRCVYDAYTQAFLYYDPCRGRGLGTHALGYVYAVSPGTS